MRTTLPLALTAAFALVSQGVAAPAPPYGELETGYSYAEIADLATAAPLALKAEIVNATMLKPEVSPGLEAGRQRYFVEAQINILLAGRADLPSMIRYLVDLPVDQARPKTKYKLKGASVLLLGKTTSRIGELQLVGPRAQIPATPENEARLRSILSSTVAKDAPPRVIGIGHAFHVAGSLPGEGETQIFVKTADNRPISLTILRRPGETPHWAVALSELVDASAEPPKPETFLWYRLACGLPRTLPTGATDGLAPDDARLASEDYALVIRELGPCDRAK